ncbi:MAG: sugar kinase [Zavarzinella sp.]
MIVTFGEAMIRLTPPDHRRLVQAYTLDVEIGGAELNTAVGIAQLGHPVRWVSRLLDAPMGHLIANRTQEAGVDTRFIQWTSTGRVGVYYLEVGASPRPSRIFYDRAESAIAQIQPGMLPWSEIFRDQRYFYVTGITAALSKGAAEAVLEALKAARQAGLTTVLDPNYRSKLWSVEDAAAWLQQAIHHVDVLVSNPEDIERFFNVKASEVEAGARETATRYSLKAVALTLRETPSVWRNTISALVFADGTSYHGPTVEVEIVDRLGTGDAFVSGLFHGMIQNNWQRAVDYGVACAAIKHTIQGDLPWLELSEVDDLLQGGGMRIRR